MQSMSKMFLNVTVALYKDRSIIVCERLKKYFYLLVLADTKAVKQYP